MGESKSYHNNSAFLLKGESSVAVTTTSLIPRADYRVWSNDVLKGNAIPLTSELEGIGNGAG